MTYPQMRTQQEIQKAHDILLSITRQPSLRRLANEIENEHLLAMAGAALCWVLAHDRAEGEESAAAGFGTLLQALTDLVHDTCDEADYGPYEVKKPQ